MNLLNTQFLLLTFSAVLTLGLMIYVKKSNKNSQINNLFFYVLLCTLIISLGVIFQTIGSYKYNINPLYFEYIIYIGTCFLPVALFFTSIVFANTKIKYKKIYLTLFIIPTISLLAIWTNKYHNLFYTNYSLNLNENEYGPYAIVHLLYTYTLFAISIIYLLKYSIRNAGFFSKQSLLIVIGALIPIIVNILGTLKIIPMTVYMTPISFSLTIFFFALAIFKFKFLSVAPIALQRIVDRMSDSYLVLNENNLITDFNESFLHTFKLKSSDVRNKDFINFISKATVNFSTKDVLKTIDKCKNSDEIVIFRREFKIANKFFNIEVSGIKAKNNYLGSLILLKDVTQHIVDKQAIEDKQSMLMEKERLASLGQMIGGIAHNLKTPIMSISGAAEGLSDLTKEYDISIGDPQVTNEDHHAIVKDMDTWIKKIREYTEYMSDVITAVKGQAVAFTEDNNESFTISELIRYVDVLMKHELQSALITLNTNVNVSENLKLNGNINSLVQVVNNMISNSIQSYNGKTNMPIDFTINKTVSSIIISIKDYGCGISKDVKQKLFKEMITTKGKNGTGLGLFMSYSNIRAHFNGDVTFESEEGKGTRFDIILPIK